MKREAFHKSDRRPAYFIPAPAFLVGARPSRFRHSEQHSLRGCAVFSPSSFTTVNNLTKFSFNLATSTLVHPSSEHRPRLTATNPPTSIGTLTAQRHKANDLPLPQRSTIKTIRACLSRDAFHNSDTDSPTSQSPVLRPKCAPDRWSSTAASTGSRGATPDASARTVQAGRKRSSTTPTNAPSAPAKSACGPPGGVLSAATVWSCKTEDGSGNVMMKASQWASATA